MNKLIFADSAGPTFQRIYNNSHFALAALLPASLVSPQDGPIAKVADVGLAATITVHNHIALNYVISDYVPRALQVPARGGVLALSALTAVGLTKLALSGPGIGGAVKELWKKK
ncbi:Succinate dehydrogenase [ubiquinone] cytochrome b small mitochondrial [Chlorella sorokiniana]|jgi:succinate dehydrogenase (ubiquinone) membrane anchor subunit|uniref:Succinate dehydrogenase [ubiquinone] cytochrome b small subunit n=1 Tax=Chlorella sorokiniana TaxID=3076 RepID=A0A2P6TBI5_CHLSO|nr:Succinate dehydrogenase [ubiquinone] cytochrome b small mitochondrial [Chlorella sorokiniana]|eukprot:PRW05913.1 Succinate dehydrogenase [ubiquinone] cytochrome b small mitochondrial [Chlorella sorokiniana]